MLRFPNESIEKVFARSKENGQTALKVMALTDEMRGRKIRNSFNIQMQGICTLTRYRPSQRAYFLSILYSTGITRVVNNLFV